MGSLLLMAGTKGKRYVLPHSKVMIHQPLISGGLSGQATDIEIHARELIDTKQRLIKLYVNHTGQSESKLSQDMERDFFMSAEMAVKYGLADHVVATRKNFEKERK
jgi:ATP-dependent Clp protease protease subunit